MTNDQRSKILEFIDDLIKYKLDQLKIDKFIEKKKEFYSIEIDSGLPLIIPKGSPLGFSYGNKIIYFSVSENGNITLSKEEEVFTDVDIEISQKYFTIFKDFYIKKQNGVLNDIIDSSYSDLNLRRESNIGKLIM
jgi:hypothetical protein